MTYHHDPATGCGWLIVIAAPLLASVVLVATGFLVGRVTAASRPAPSQAFPESAWTRIGAPPSFAGAPSGALSDAPSPPGGSARPASTPEPAAIPLRRAPGSLEGVASWFDNGPGLYAAAGPALRVGSWRGRIVTVCATACVRVRLVDFCGCLGTRLIDLSPDAFAALAPLSRGLVRVSVG